MKLTFLCFNLIIFATAHAHLSTVPGVIYDTSGNNLHRGIPYYILPLLHGSGGGLILSGNTTDPSCPMINIITQEPFEINGGIPFTFNPIVLDENLIRISYPTSIESAVVTPCGGSNIWKVSTAKSDIGDVAGLQIVTTGGEFNTPESCFQIVEVDMMPELRSYQIQHCPFKCGSSSTDLNCYNVGVKLDAAGKRCVAPSNALFPVVFVGSVGKQSTFMK
ncbi:miraculin-like [Cynara cardunculus var. scolymus]|uniref:miraculin-like n=1 Tax=Cynara cardunculus var. scolymus TaxID=59895 RepID=UPI000D624081|nr:miraculin-like [Cynara cardunculus var. scolymus]